jgi:hypothetical protein
MLYDKRLGREFNAGLHLYSLRCHAQAGSGAHPACLTGIPELAKLTTDPYLVQCSATGVPPQGLRLPRNFVRLYIRTLYLEKGNILSFVIIIRNTHTHTHTHTLVHHPYFYSTCVMICFRMPALS